MNGMNDIETKTSEAEERNVPVAKLVKAPDFHSAIAGSSPVRNTEKNWDRNIVAKTDTINGREFTRLSVLQL